MLSLLYSLQGDGVGLPVGLSPYHWPSDGVPAARSAMVPTGALSVHAMVLRC